MGGSGWAIERDRGGGVGSARFERSALRQFSDGVAQVTTEKSTLLVLKNSDLQDAFLKYPPSHAGA